MTKVIINSQETSLKVAPETPVLWALRDTLGLTGTKYGCGVAQCGACTVHLDGQAIRSCVTPIRAADGKELTTIEGLQDDPIGKLVQETWVEHDVAQCGYCQSGQVMSATALLKSKKNPSDKDIADAMSGNICRCGTYQRIRAAIKAAAKRLA